MLKALPALVPDQVAYVPTDAVHPDLNQPRTEFDVKALEELATDIALRGIENPIRVRADYTIKHGERRWRAAQLAKLDTVPVLLTADPVDEQNAALVHYLDQAADNEHQLKPSQLDRARFLKKLTEEFGVAVKEVPELLAARGITMSRSYISNIIRLLDLPKWAQDLIVAGGLAPAAGKYILMAKPSAKASAKLEELVRDAMKEHEKGYGGAVTTDYLEELVLDAFHEVHTGLNKGNYGDDAPRFDWQKECKPCPDRHEVKDHQFCCNRTCYDAKQDKARIAAEAKAAKKKGKGDPASEPEKAKAKAKPKPQEPTKFKLNADGVADVRRLAADKYETLDAGNVRFNVAVHCEGCQWNQPALHAYERAPRPTCFNPAHYAELQRQGSREEAIAQWLDRRVIPLVRERVKTDDGLAFQLIAWMALGAGTQTSAEGNVHGRLVAEQARARRRLNLRALGDVVRACDDERLPSEAIADAGVTALGRDRAHLYTFARYADVALTPAIASLDREYLEIKQKAELLELLRKHGCEILPEVEKGKRGDILELCLARQNVEKIGVPYDVAALYEKLTPMIEPDLEDEFDDEDDADDDGEIASAEDSIGKPSPEDRRRLAEQTEDA